MLIFFIYLCLFLRDQIVIPIIPIFYIRIAYIHLQTNLTKNTLNSFFLSPLSISHSFTSIFHLSISFSNMLLLPLQTNQNTFIYRAQNKCSLFAHAHTNFNFIVFFLFYFVFKYIATLSLNGDRRKERERDRETAIEWECVLCVFQCLSVCVWEIEILRMRVKVTEIEA